MGACFTIKIKIYDKYIMYKFHKRNNKKNKGKIFLQSSQIKYSPFDLKDTEYLKHLHEQMKLRNSQEASVALRKKIDEGNKRANYVNELDRMMGELYRPNLPHTTKEHLNKWYEDTKKLIFT